MATGWPSGTVMDLALHLATSVGGQGGRSGIPAGTVSHSFSWAHDSRIYGFQARGHTSGDTVG